MCSFQAFRLKFCTYYHLFYECYMPHPSHTCLIQTDDTVVVQANLGIMPA
jgi:hypothetical protein